MTARIEHLVTSGTFSLDGGTWEADNNVWIVGDDTEVVVIDAPTMPSSRPWPVAAWSRSPAPTPTTITCGSRRNSPTGVGAPILLHPDDRPVWELTHPDRDPGGTLLDGGYLEVAGTTLHVLHTPCHAPGAV